MSAVPSQETYSKMLQCTGLIAIISVSMLCLGSYAEMFACVLPHPRACLCGHVLSVAIQGVGCSHHVRCPHALYALLLLYWWIPRKACCEALLSQMLQVTISFEEVVKISTISLFHQRTNRPAPHSPADLQMQVVCSCNSVSE